MNGVLQLSIRTFSETGVPRSRNDPAPVSAINSDMMTATAAIVITRALCISYNMLSHICMHSQTGQFSPLQSWCISSAMYITEMIMIIAITAERIRAAYLFFGSFLFIVPAALFTYSVEYRSERIQLKAVFLAQVLSYLF